MVVIKKYHLLLVFTCFFAISVSMVFMTHIAVASSADDAAPVESEVSIGSDVVADIGEPSSSGVSLQVGDIICQDGKWDWLIPGRYSHTQIYVGNGKVIESDPDGGVHYSSVSNGWVYRVSTSSSKKASAVSWIKGKVGLSYDWNLFSKQVTGSRYYCSELDWAAYKAVGGPDIDQNPGWSWTYYGGVAPTEIADDGNTYYVGAL